MNNPSELPPPEHYRNVSEYSKELLDVTDRPLSPSAISDMYGCTNVHARKSLAELVKDTNNDVDRVSRGQYVSNTGESRSTTGDTTITTGPTTNDEATTDQQETTKSYNSTADLYQRQYDIQGDDTNDEATTDQQATTTPLLPMEPQKLLVILIIAGGILVVAGAVSGDSTDSTQQNDHRSDLDLFHSDISSSSSADIEGGLI